MDKIISMYFSPTGTTKKIISALREDLRSLGKEQETIDVTPPQARKKDYAFGPKELLILGLPVYAGRIPNKILPFIQTLKGDQTPAVIVAMYGNRNYDNALMEMSEVLTNNGFIVFGAAAFIGEHSFSKTLGGGRPDEEDFKILHNFSKELKDFMERGAPLERIPVKGEVPVEYYKPKDREGKATGFLKAKPVTSDSCTECMLCVAACPMGSIDEENPRLTPGLCIKCCACIKICPVNARAFEDEQWIRHKEALEEQFMERKEPEVFVPKAAEKI